MLDACVNQGAGLQRLALQSAAPRLIAMASHGDQRGELPLLWSLCTQLVELAYSVVVLDAHTEESDANPGLRELLAQSGWRGENLSDANGWSVMPAKFGLDIISRRALNGATPLGPLNGVLSHYGVIVLYASAEVLSSVLPGTGVAPLLTVSPLKMSSVTAYQSLKQMLLNAGLRSTVAHIALGPLRDSGPGAHRPVQHLQECAMEFLGYQLNALTIRADEAQERIADDVRRLTLRLLENAVPLDRDPVAGAH